MTIKRIRNYKYLIRKSHRYLGIFIGIQFLFWTLGGLYFSWTNIKEIRGDHLKNIDSSLEIEDSFVSLSEIRSDKDHKDAGTLIEAKLVKVDSKPFYLLTTEPKQGPDKLMLFSAIDGKQKDRLTRDEAIRIATKALKKPSEVENTALLTEKDVGSHHEIRGAPLPAWAITFHEPANLTVYVSADSGQIISFRTTKWRIFDFLWMLHTMDFNGRDDINNYVLRAFSILGIVTILSGFLLFGVSSKTLRKIRRR